MRVVIAVIVSVFVVAVATREAPADWPQFRGPDAMGHADVKGLPVRWSETENVVWKTPIAGLGWSSPVVHAGRIYLTTATETEGDGRSLRLVCLDAKTGAVAWDKELFTQAGPVRIHAKNSHASPTPLVVGDRLIVHFGPHGTACTSLDGEVVWKRTLPYAPQHGNGGSPAVAKDVVVICCDGSDEQYVVGLDLATGDIRWRTDRETEPKKGFSFATPLVTTVDGVEQVICPGSDAVFTYDPATGRELWRVDYPNGYSVIPRPVHAAGLVFVVSGYDKPVLYAIDPTGRGNVTETHVRWKLDRGAPHTPSVLVVGDELYCVSDNGVATCLDARSGEERWRERLGGNYSASPLHADGVVYFQNETGEAVVVKAAAAFEEVARNRLGDGERTFASYAVDGGSLIVRSESALYRIGK
ncbi:MAG: serine/threonine protein kinase [Actinobacteria bacterium]|nr:serine/threonine protein kinase [Actinomycetota bacterium]